MKRFAWVQSRTQTLTVLAVIAVLAGAAAITGVQLFHLYNSLVAHCHTGCDLATTQFLSHDQFLDQALDMIARAAPPLIGIFWGAPLLARELETGTYRLVWTQGVTRSRWLITKLGVVGLATVVVAGALTLTVTWWHRGIDIVNSNQYALFDRRDIAPIAYAIFAFALGALIGAIIRRPLPAMAVTLGVYVFALTATTLWVRPHLLPPIHETMSPFSAGQFGVASTNGSAMTLIADGSGPPNSWTLSSQIVTNAGRTPSSAELVAWVHQYCPKVGLPPAAPPGGGVARVIGPDAGQACLDQAAKTFQLLVTYQPANRYWTFQWLETGIFVALAIAAAAGCYWWVTRRTY